MKKFDLRGELHHSQLFTVAAQTRLPRIGGESACSIVALAPRRPMTLAEWGAGLFGFGADTPVPTVAWLISEKNVFLSSDRIEEIVRVARNGSPILRRDGWANMAFISYSSTVSPYVSVLTLRSLDDESLGPLWGPEIAKFSGEQKCSMEFRLLIRVP